MSTEELSPITNVGNHARSIHALCYRHINLNDVTVICKLLGLRKVDVIRISSSIENLRNIASLALSDKFFRKIFESCTKLLIHKSDLQDLYPSLGGESARSNNFNISAAKFSENPVLGMWAGTPVRVTRSDDNPFEITLEQMCFLVLGYKVSTLSVHAKTNHVDRFSDNLRKLISDPGWSESLKLSIFYDEIPVLKQLAADFIKKISSRQTNCTNQYHLQFLKQALEALEDLIKYHNFVPVPKAVVTTEPEDLENPKVLIKKVLEKQESEDDKQEQQGFINSLSLRGFDRNNHIFVNSWDSLSNTEIEELEAFIHQPDTETNDNYSLSQSRRLALGLMLYYSVPYKKISTIKFGMPGTGDSTSDNKEIFIDVEEKLIFLPSAYPGSITEFYGRVSETHTPLPLVLSLVNLLIKLNYQELECLGQALEINFNIKPSFKWLPHFKQYRFTDKKINSTLWKNIAIEARDEVVASYMQGGAFLLQPMGLYYTRLPVQYLVSVFTSVFKKIFPVAQLSTINEKNLQGSLGSVMTPESKEIAVFFANKVNELAELKKLKFDYPTLERFHNAYTLYCVNTLNIASTHRSINDPYYSEKTFFDEFCQITDKNLGPGYEGRAVVLGKEALRQLKEYKRYRNLLNATLKKQNIAVNIEASDPNNGIPFFFLLKEKCVVSVCRKDLEDYLNPEETGLAHNYHRHYFSSFIPGFEVTRDQRSAQMGHVAKGKVFFGETSSLSLNDFRDQMQPFVDALFTNLKIKPVSTLAPRKDFPDLSELFIQCKSLGPFEREGLSKVKLSIEEIREINTLLFGSPDQPENLYIDQSIQHQWLSKLSKHQYSYKRFQLFLKYHRKKSGWRYAKISTIEKSPFDKNFAFKYHSAKEVKQALNSYVISQKDGERSEQESMTVLKSMLILSVIYNSNQFSHIHLQSLANSKYQDFFNLPISKAILLHPENRARKVFILDSFSVFLLNLCSKRETEFDNTPIDLDAIPKTVYEAIPEMSIPISMHISYAISIARVILPGVLIAHSIDENSSSSLSKSELFTLMGYKGSSNDKPVVVNQSIGKQWNVETGSDSIVNTIKDILSRRKNDLKSIEICDELKAAKPLITSTAIEKLILEWMIFESDADIPKSYGKRLKPISITTYLYKTYKSLVDVFQTVDVLSLDEDELIEDYYPKVFSHAAEYSKVDSPHITEFQRFHAFLTSQYGVAPLKFLRNQCGFPMVQVETASIINYGDYKNALKVIPTFKSLDPFVIKPLQLCLIFLYRFGLRAGELVKIRLSDVNIVDQVIHIASNHLGKEKTLSGNRFIEINLLDKEEKTLLNEFYQNRSAAHFAGTESFLFSQFQGIETSVVTASIRKFVITLLRNISGNPLVNLKSFRKSYASYAFLGMSIPSGLSAINKIMQLPAVTNMNSDYVSNRFFGQVSAKPFNELWALAKTIGHTTPGTTQKSYTHIQDVPLFILSESEVAQARGYIGVLKEILAYSVMDSLKAHNAVNNARKRYPCDNYMYLFNKFIFRGAVYKSSTSHEISFDLQPGSEIELFKKVLALWCFCAKNNLSDNREAYIARKLLVSESYVLKILSTFKGIFEKLFGVTIDDDSLAEFINQVLSFRVINNSFKTIQTSQIAKKFITQLERCDDEEFFQLLIDEWYENFDGFERGMLTTNQNLVLAFGSLFSEETRENLKVIVQVEHGRYVNADIPDLKAIPGNVSLKARTGAGAKSKVLYECKFLFSTKKGPRNRNPRTDTKSVHETILLIALAKKLKI